MKFIPPKFSKLGEKMGLVCQRYNSLCFLPFCLMSFLTGLAEAGFPKPIPALSALTHTGEKV
jgi:hypothetical protein